MLNSDGLSHCSVFLSLAIDHSLVRSTMGDGHGVIAFPGISIQGFPYQQPFRPLTHFYLVAITLLGDFNQQRPQFVRYNLHPLCDLLGLIRCDDGMFAGESVGQFHYFLSFASSWATDLFNWLSIKFGATRLIHFKALVIPGRISSVSFSRRPSATLTILSSFITPGL